MQATTSPRLQFRHIAVPLAAVYIWVAASFDATPKQLGFLTLSRALVQALASPLGGIMGALRRSQWLAVMSCNSRANFRAAAHVLL